MMNDENSGSRGAETTGLRPRPADIRARSFAYALRAIKLYQFLEKQRGGAARIVGRQSLRAATSIGANIEEAQSAESRPDFIHKCGVAQKEARESQYWLKLLAGSGIVAEKKLHPMIQETDEILAILSSIIIHAKRNRVA